MASTILSAKASEVKIDGSTIEGLQSIDYKVNRNRTNVEQVGSDERIGVDYGLKDITGTLTVTSASKKLDGLLAKSSEEAEFQIVAVLKKGETSYTITFDHCYLDDKSFTMDANGVGTSTYKFSATSVKEE